MAAADINSWTGVGRLTADPELRSTPTGTSICEARIAVNGRVKTQNGWEDYANFFVVTAFDKQAENLAKHTKKGDRIGVVGRLQQKRWQAQDGGNRERVGISAVTIQFLQPKAQTTTTQTEDEEVPF